MLATHEKKCCLIRDSKEMPVHLTSVMMYKIIPDIEPMIVDPIIIQNNLLFLRTEENPSVVLI